MTRRRVFAVTVVLSAIALVGCMAKPSPAPVVEAPSAAVVEMIRLSYKTVFQDAVVGVVTAVLADQPYAYVGQIETKSIKANDFITFLGADESPVANGQVVKVEAEGLTVKFTAGARPPRVGDAAVKF